MAEVGAAVDHDIFGHDGIEWDPEIATSRRELEERSDKVPFMGGRIRFLSDESGSLSPSVSSYVSIPGSFSVGDIADLMMFNWKMSSPKVILSILTSTRHYRIWKNQKQVEDFQKGIVKAANATNMWILTDGLDNGISKIIGDAISEEHARRQSLNSGVAIPKNMLILEKLPPLNVIGISAKSDIAYGNRLFDHRDLTKTVLIKNEGIPPHYTKYELNPAHTHFLLAENATTQKDVTNFRCKIEERFMQPIDKSRIYQRNLSSSTEEGDAHQHNAIPPIGLLIQGGPEEIDHTLEMVKKRIPVIVMKGSGLAADLIAYAYEELKDRYDDEHINLYVKPELMKRVNECFPGDFEENEFARNQCRDRILECISCYRQGQQEYLTLLRTEKWDSDLTNLDKYILKAIFKAQRTGGSHWKECVERDLHLLIDWNRCDLARTEIFLKNDWTNIKVESSLFHQSLLRKDRQGFVELFLEKGFVVHQYLRRQCLLELFNEADDMEFFEGVCLHRMLGLDVDVDSSSLKMDFVDEQFNFLLETCTRLPKLVQLHDKAEGYVSSNTDVGIMERRAVNALVYWAVLTNRTKLAKILWKKTDDPIALALIVSMILHKLSGHCADQDLRNTISKTADDFGKMAVSIFNLSYSDSTIQAFSLLNKKLLDFNNKTVMELAHISQNKHFISHPCCQKWLQMRMNGKLEIREITRGSIKFPVWLKIYLCAFLVFPMFFWIHFDSNTNERKKFQYYVQEEDEESNQSEFSPLTRQMPISPTRKAVARRQDRFSTKICCQPPLWKRIYLLWSAPITKFWISQLFYLIYLMLFSLAVILPTCGNLYLDLVIFFWTLLIWVDIMRRIFIKINKYPELSLFWSWVEVMAIGFYLLLFLMFRIVAHAVPYTDYTTMKTIMSLGLIYFYYRTLVIFLPISPELGPMLVNILRMVQRDFFTWMSMFLIFMISGGITVQAVLYPNSPLSKEVIKRAFSRAMFALFLTKIDDLDGDPQCTYLYDQGRLGYCGYENDPNITDAIRDALSTCPHDSPGGYIILIQYLLITKLVLITLLYAMFSVTIARVSSEATQIWKFQRYGLIIDFEERLCLPPPLCLISYIWLVLSFIGRHCRKMYNRYHCRRCTQNDSVDQMILTKIKRSADYNYWKICTKQFSVLEEEEYEAKERGKNQSNMMQNVMEDLRKQEKSNKKLEEKIIHLEKGLTTSLLLLEEMKHMIGNLDPKSHGIVITSPTIHLASRQSPYPGTNHQRFPVFDKFVPWVVPYESYDPILYSKPAMEFDIDIQPFVDINILQFKMSEEEDRKFTSQANVATVSFPHPEDLSWNCARTEGTKDNAVEVNRTSWITKGGQTVRYELDTAGLPLNSQGRTGIRGHGSLCRWGPNHIIQAVLTRWKKKYLISRPQDYLLLDGKRVLEFLAIKNGSGECYLPGGNVYGSTSSYSVLCTSFKRSVLKDEGADVTTRLDENSMISFFADFAATRSRSSRFMDKSPTIVPGFSSQVMYRGYLDDPQNTDNAWMEAEVWNFHYSLGDSLDDKIEDGKYEWKEVSPYLRLHGNQASIVQEAARLHDAYY